MKLDTLLKEAQKLVGLTDEKFKIVFKPMKTKVSSISFSTRTIRLNSLVVPLLGEEELKYLLVHELVPYKTRSQAHGRAFWGLMDKLYPPRVRERIENNILRALILAESRCKVPALV